MNMKQGLLLLLVAGIICAASYTIVKRNLGVATGIPISINCIADGSIASVMSINGKPLKPDQLSTSQKLEYLDLLRDFWTRNLSSLDAIAMNGIPDDRNDTQEPQEKQLLALYEAHKSSFPRTMKREEIMVKIREMVLTQNKHQSDTEQRLKAVREGVLTYTSPVQCGPRLDDMKSLAGETSTDVVMIGSFFCPECRINFRQIVQRSEGQANESKKTPMAHVALAAVEGSADFVMARAEICVNSQYADKTIPFTDLAHAMPPEAATSEKSALDGLDHILGELKIGETAFHSCLENHATIASAKKRVEVFSGLNPLSTSVVLFKNRPIVLRRDHPEEIQSVIKSLPRQTKRSADGL
jgi:hypothetical protein